MKQGFCSPYPHHTQELLLRAALLGKEDAAQAWDEWTKTFRFEDPIDYGSFRLLPLVYHKLREIHPAEPLLPKLKAAYKQTWYKNQQLMYRCGQVLGSLHDQGVSTLVLKGAAYSVLYYKDMGLRPMADIDLMIPAKDARAIINKLILHDWKIDEGEEVEYNLRYGKALGFTDPDGFEVDLHWHPFLESHSLGAEEFWERSSVIEIGGVQTRALSATDNLLHTIVHGIRWNPVPPIRWIPDSMMIMREGGAIDWEFLLRLTRQYRVAVQVQKGLSYLAETYNAPVPRDVLHKLSAHKPSYAERYVYRQHLRENAESLPEAFFPRLKYLFGVYLRQTSKRSIWTQIPGFLAYLHFRLRGKNYLAILRHYSRNKGIFRDKESNQEK